MEEPSKLSAFDLGPTNNDFKRNQELSKQTILHKIDSFRVHNLKIAVCLGLLLVSFINANFNILMSTSNLPCYQDNAQILMESFYSILKSNILFTNLFIIILSVITDLLFFYVITIWFINTKSNLRLIISILILVIVCFIFKHLLLIKRSSQDNLFTLSFPSLIFSFSQNDSFLFNIDIGVLNILLNEISTLNKTNQSNQDKIEKFKIFMIYFLIILISLVKIACRGCFFPDIIISFCFSELIYNLVSDFYTEDKKEYLKKHRRFSSD